MAFHDTLTGMYNRRAFDTKYLVLFDQSKNMKEPMSVVVIDIDFFKSINDTYGHLVGDEVIKNIGEQLLLSIRSHDICARRGGEEFIVLLPLTQLEQAFEISERMRANIEKFVKTPDYMVTCSFGLAQREDGESAKKLLERADANLYKAKENGRNRCEK
jgi:diguanylate cyclase (GGDEF)-like protein